MLTIAVQVTLALIPSTRGYTCSRSAPFHPAIHNMGNVGAMGALHADGAWFFTRLIDTMAYGGRNMRSEVSQGLASLRGSESTILEVGCGVGTLTKELELFNFTNVIAIDTSQDMIRKAQQHTSSATYYNMNGVDTFNHFSEIDVAIVCMVMHEMPQCAHHELLCSLLNTISDDGEIWLIDINPEYNPSISMLAGEPYLLDYLKDIESTILKASIPYRLSVVDVIPDRVRGWIIRK